jgi:GNAT superfamily N-acetyltransferase
MNVVRIDNSYHNEVLNLFGQDVDKFQFIISDLMRNNYCGEQFKVFGEFEDNKFQSILISSFNNLTYYAKEDRSVEVYSDIIKSLNFQKITGPSDLVEKLLPFVEVDSDGKSYLGYVPKVSLKRSYPNLEIRFISSEEEIGLEYELLMSTEEYHGVLPDNREDYINGQRGNINRNSRTAYLSVDNKMIASASTVAEYGKSAIVTGVVTNPNYRNKGYGTEVLISLFESLLKEGKFPYLFYNNPAARSVYKKIGTEEVCQWRVVFTK